jgi:UV DNA damage endonuclease
MIIDQSRMNDYIGYACIQHGSSLTTGRTCRKATLESKDGLQICGAKALENLIDLEKMLEFNLTHGIYFLRISSIFPWGHKYDFSELPNYNSIKRQADRCANVIKKHNIRITCHPSQYVCLASPNPNTITESLADLELHGRQMDLLGLPRNHWAKINIHIGGSYGDHDAAMKRWCDSFSALSDAAKARLTVENDDKPNGWSVSMLMSVHEITGCPIVFDSLHWELGPKVNPVDHDYSESLDLALSTWSEVTPVVHHSESRKLHEDKSVSSSRAHTDKYYNPFPNPNNRNVHIMLESKHKEIALIDYRNKFIKETNGN